MLFRSIISKKTILKNHPFVEDADAEMKQLEEEEQQAQEKAEAYTRAFLDKGQEGDDGEDGSDTGDTLQSKEEKI